LIYIPTGETITVALDRLPGKSISASWYDPRTGLLERIGNFEDQVRTTFDPPGEPDVDNDWVLVLKGS
jgi:hypothetical protein